MRGVDERGCGLFSYVDLEARVPADHPLREIRVLVDEALAALSPDFAGLYSKTGRPSIAPEKLLRALLLQAFYTIRSERQLMEQLDYNLLFRWFVGLSMDAPVWDTTTYSKNRDRLVAGDVAARFLQAVLRGARVRRLLSDEHFSVDGTLIEAWASMKSFRRSDGGDADPPGGRNAERDFRGERRSNATHASTTDADARLFRKGEGQSSRLCYMGHLLMENRNALIVDAALTRTSGTAEREAALAMLGRRCRRRRITLGADKGYDVAAFVDALRERAVTPHIAVDGHPTRTGKRRKTRIDRRTTRHPATPPARSCASASRRRPALVVLDLVLPGVDSIELMRTLPALADLPVIFVSAYGGGDTIARALEAGAADYIVKPYSPVELAARVSLALRRRTAPGTFRIGDLEIDRDKRRVTLADDRCGSPRRSTGCSTRSRSTRAGRAPTRSCSAGCGGRARAMRRRSGAPSPSSAASLATMPGTPDTFSASAAWDTACRSRTGREGACATLAPRGSPPPTDLGRGSWIGSHWFSTVGTWRARSPRRTRASLEDAHESAPPEQAL